MIQNGKIAVVGAGYVGATFAYALMISGLASHIVLIDANHERAEGEAMDLNHGASFARPVAIHVGDYPDCAGAEIVVITAGTAQQPGESRLALVQRNLAVYRQIIKKIILYAEEAVLLIVTNPVDVMSYAAWKLSGFPSRRVIGAGTVLDTSRLRYLLSQHCRVDVKNVHAYIIGEHGDSEVPVWSLANVAGMRFEQYCISCERRCDRQEREGIFSMVKESAYEVISRKGATYYAVGLALVEIVQSILRNENSVLTVSSLLQDYHGIQDVYLSVPAIVNRKGILRQIPLDLSPDEFAQLRQSASIVKKVISSLDLA